MAELFDAVFDAISDADRDVRRNLGAVRSAPTPGLREQAVEAWKSAWRRLRTAQAQRGAVCSQETFCAMARIQITRALLFLPGRRSRVNALVTRHLLRHRRSLAAFNAGVARVNAVIASAQELPRWCGSRVAQGVPRGTDRSEIVRPGRL